MTLHLLIWFGLINRPISVIGCNKMGSEVSAWYGAAPSTGCEGEIWFWDHDNKGQTDERPTINGC